MIVNIGNKNGAGNPPYTNVGTPLASSPKLRQAFEEAIDRDTLNRVVFSGRMQPSCTWIPAANTLWYEATKVACTPYDPKHARQLVAASGYTNPAVHLLVNNATDDLRLAQFLQAEESAVGINVVIDATDSPTATARVTSGSYDVRFAGRFPGDVDPSTGMIMRLASWGSSNYSGYSNPRLDLVLDNGRKATDRAARSTLYRVAQQIIRDDRPIIVLYNQVTSAAVSARLTGVRLAYNGQLRIENAQYR